MVFGAFPINEKFVQTEEINMRKQSGFTLIELMIVIAILGILMAIAIPAYSDYTIRAKVSEGINLAAGAKLAVSEYRLSEGKMPASNTDAGINATVASTYVSGLVISTGGVVTMTYQSIDTAVDSSTLQLYPTIDATKGGAVNWTCEIGKTNGIDKRFVPSSCRNAASN
jgi:type IV pilus assembly protein PilA